MTKTNWDLIEISPSGERYYNWMLSLHIPERPLDQIDAYKKHFLLELLGALEVFQYESGYDSHYYDIYIPVTKENT